MEYLEFMGPLKFCNKLYVSKLRRRHANVTVEF